MGNTFDELLQMATGEPNENYIPLEEVDFHGMRENSCEEFSGEEDDGNYYDAEEELELEALFCAPKLLHAPADESAGRACDAFKRKWELGKYVTVDEMMIGYKGSYCPATQYMLNKLQKWGIKVWCLSDSKSKYVYDFDIYCGRNGNGAEEPGNVAPVEGSVATNVVLDLVNGLEGRGHVVVTDNYFTSVGLFTELASREIYATGTMRSNCVGVPRPFNNLRTWRDSEQGTLDWRTHSSHGISCVVWKDKRPILLLSTSAVPVQLPCIAPTSIATVPRRNGAIREPIQTSPVHLEYTTFMRGVDVADQLRASYSCQSRSHKWWHRAFHFLLDQTVVNMYIIYLGLCGSAQYRRNPMKHLQFKMQVCQALLQGWRERDRHVRRGRRNISTHLPRQSRLNRPCVLCGELCNFLCPHCNRQFLCLNEGCFEAYHRGQRRGRIQRRRRNYNA
jgi:hypothetical protein